MQRVYVEGFALAVKEVFDQFVRRNSGSALVHDHAGSSLKGSTKADKAYQSLLILR